MLRYWLTHQVVHLVSHFISFHSLTCALQGVLAKDKDLQAAFGTTDLRAICLEILARGELQVGRSAG